MKKKIIRILTSLILLFCALPSFATWTNLNTGINDNLTGVVFLGNNGVLSGHKGLYYTTTGGNGSSSWTRFNISNNANDSLLYSRTRFHDCYTISTGTSLESFACGRDTINNRAVIIKLTLPSLNYSIVYLGNVNTSLNSIGYTSTYNDFYAVGDSGLVVKFNTTTAAAAVSSSLTDNLLSIDFYGSNFWIGANEKVIKGTVGFTSFTYTISTEPGKSLSEVAFYTYAYGYAVGNGYFYSSGSNVDEYTYYDYGPLNGRAILVKGYFIFVGTDHGIFRTPLNSPQSIDILEWQPSSLNYKINDFFSRSSDPTIYACGENGVLLSISASNAAGNTTKPYTSLNLTGRCVNQPTPISGIVGSSTSCNWNINGTYVNSNCNGFNHTFTTTGTYTIELIVYNGAYQDTSIQNISIVDTPTINSAIIVLDSTVCQKEPIFITIDSSQSNVYYTLRKFGVPAMYGSSMPGNGAALSFWSDSISSSGAYYIMAQSTIANCTANFRDTINLVAEKTNADFRSLLHNAGLGETVYFQEQCTDAQHFIWTFPPSATTLNSNQPNPSNSFTTTGPSIIKLLCFSDAGCADSIQKPGPFIYSPPQTIDSCWVNINLGVDRPWPGYYIEDIEQLSPSKDASYFICGSYNDNVFHSQNGDSLVLFGEGGYMLKYNQDGTLKWWVHVPNGLISTVVEDSEKNLYVGGYAANSFIDNKGDTLQVSGYFIVKLDTLGQKIWIVTSGVFPEKITIDNSDNLIIFGNDRYSYNGSFYILNGTVTATLYQGWSSQNYPYRLYFYFKIDKQGNLLWNSRVDIYATNTDYITKIDVDSLNNIYITGGFEYNIIFYSSSGQPMDTINTPASVYGYGGRLFLAKLDSNGTFLWSGYANTVNYMNGRTYPMDMVTDRAGNCYITGSNNCHTPATQFAYYNTDSSTTFKSTGQFFIMKVNSQGICEWINGANHTYNGWGKNILLHEGELKVLGQIGDGFNGYTTARFTSVDSNFRDLTIGASDYFIATYDTSGRLIRVCMNGNNGNNLSFSEFAGLFRGLDSCYYVARNFYNGFSNYMNFGVNISTLQGRDGYVTKFVESCGNCYQACSPVVNIAETIRICPDSVYVLPSGITVTAPGTYYSILQNGNGCDSLHITTVILEMDFNVQFTDVSCYGYQDGVLILKGANGLPPYSYSIDGGVTYVANDTFFNLPTGTYYLSARDSMGCTKSATQTIQVSNVVDTNLTFLNNTLTSNASNVDFYWIDCNTGDTIAGEHNNSFSPLANGSYAAILVSSIYNCQDTTPCTTVVITSESYHKGTAVLLYPNPTKDRIIIDFSQVVSNTQIRLLAIDGSTLQFFEFQQKKIFELHMTTYPEGFYLLEVKKEGEQKEVFKVGKY